VACQVETIARKALKAEQGDPERGARGAQFLIQCGQRQPLA